MYREFAPPPGLAARVECFWAIDGDLTGQPAIQNRVLPDGCMDVIFDLVGASRHGLTRFVVGAMTRASVVPVSGRIDMLGVRFRPGGAGAFVPIPAAELTDLHLPLEDVWRGEAADLEERLAGTVKAEARVRLLAERLLRRQDGADEVRRLVAATAARIEATGGRVTVRALADDAGVTTRHLERAFAAAVGLTPKQACRVARFRRVMAILVARPRIAWTELAYECGYHDQPHLAREIRALSGLTPTELRVAYAQGDVAFVQDDSPDSR